MKTDPAKLNVSQLEGAIAEHATDRKFKERVRKILHAHEDRLVIETPHKLSDAEVAAIVKQLGLSEKKTLEIEQHVDPSLLAGLIVKFKNHYFDFSLKGSLSEIAQSLQM